MEDFLGYIIAAAIVIFILYRMRDSKPNGSAARVLEYLTAAITTAGVLLAQLFENGTF